MCNNIFCLSGQVLSATNTCIRNKNFSIIKKKEKNVLYLICFCFCLSQVSANCGICARYLIQSSFIISSLRPIFFRMYEIENPQIMQELFVHTWNKDSLLRTDVIDAHFVMWFGSQNGKLIKNFDRIDPKNAKFWYPCLEISILLIGE